MTYIVFLFYSKSDCFSLILYLWIFFKFWHITVVHSFSLMHSLTLYKLNTFFLLNLDQHVGCFIFWALKINATIAFSADIFWYIGIGFPEFILRNFGQSVSSFAKYHSTVVKTWLYQSTTHLHLHGIKIFIGSHPYQLLLLSVILILIFLMEVYLFSFSIQLSFKYFLCICYTHLNG